MVLFLHIDLQCPLRQQNDCANWYDDFGAATGMFAQEHFRFAQETGHSSSKNVVGVFALYTKKTL